VVRPARPDRQDAAAPRGRWKRGSRWKRGIGTRWSGGASGAAGAVGTGGAAGASGSTGSGGSIGAPRDRGRVRVGRYNWNGRHCGNSRQGGTGGTAGSGDRPAARQAKRDPAARAVRPVARVVPGIDRWHQRHRRIERRYRGATGGTAPVELTGGTGGSTGGTGGTGPKMPAPTRPRSPALVNGDFSQDSRVGHRETARTSTCSRSGLRQPMVGQYLRGPAPSNDAATGALSQSFVSRKTQCASIRRARRRTTSPNVRIALYQGATVIATKQASTATPPSTKVSRRVGISRRTAARRSRSALRQRGANRAGDSSGLGFDVPRGQWTVVNGQFANGPRDGRLLATAIPTSSRSAYDNRWSVSTYTFAGIES
jgi:hypothetical protein